MLGLVVAGDLITLFVFWELTTVISYLLIGTDHENTKARRAALHALLITGIGGLALLAGFILMAGVAGGFGFGDVFAAAYTIQAAPLYTAILALILIGAFTKSAQMPVHFWLPNAMAAPTPISAYLHSATMVKACVYLLGRLHPALGGTPEWAWTLTFVGAITAVGASVIALRQTDLKLALAYSTVMALGTLVLFLGAEAEVAIAAAVTFLLVHALYKCALFLVIGIIDHGTGTRDISRLGGLAKVMPLTTVIAATAGFSMAGFPPFLGFVGKELKYEGALAIASEPLLGLVAAVSANAMMVALAITVAAKPFVGTARPTPQSPHEPAWTMLLPVALLSACGFVFGMVPGLLADILVQPAVTAIRGEPAEVKLALWHGINLPLLLSITTVVLGLLLFFSDGRLIALVSHLPSWNGEVLFERGIDGFKGLCAAFARATEGSALNRHAGVTIGVVWLSAGAILVVGGGMAWPSPALPPTAAWIMTAMIAVGLIVVLRARTSLAGVAGLGAVGSGMAGLFFVAGGPDVALTQFLVEVLFVAVAVLVLVRIPPAIRSAVGTKGVPGRVFFAGLSG
ncbi:MAG: DUF4040 domain-containing protein, partial [Rhodospirillales bacterium]|nr:DUF4040 domain-containing protein [Rhodospirillales bacterium]